MVEANLDYSANTATSDGSPVRLAGDQLGRLINVGPCDRGARLRNRVAIADGSSVSVLSAPGAGLYNEVWVVIISNTTSAAQEVHIQDGVGGTTLATFPAPANTNGAVLALPVPITGSSNTAIAVDPSGTGSTVTVTLLGCKAK
jgi:hypothetical protein